MNQQNREENGEELPLRLVLPLGSRRRGSMTAIVRTTTLDEQRQAQFDAAVEDLLAQLVRRQVKEGVGKCPTRITPA
jgi:hypothetical protein